jgi:hypothetical protein
MYKPVRWYPQLNRARPVRPVQQLLAPAQPPPPAVTLKPPVAPVPTPAVSRPPNR